MLRKHEIDLIAGLAEGTLEDESEARALIERSAEARAEYEAQRTALEALRDTDPVTMTETERAALRRDVWTALRHDQATTARSTPWYYRLAPVAAALLVIVGLGAVLTQGFLDQQADEAALTAETFADVADGLSPEPTTGGGGEADDTADTTAAMRSDTDDGAVDEESAPAALTLDDAFATVAEAVRTGSEIDDTIVFRFIESAEEVEEAARCLENAGLTNRATVGEFEEPSEGDTSYFVAVEPSDEIGPDTQVVFVHTQTCQIAHVDG